MTGFEVLILINTIFIVWIMFELKEIKQQLNQPKTEKSKNETFKYKGRLNKLW